MSYSWDDDSGSVSGGMDKGGHDFKSAKKAYESSSDDSDHFGGKSSSGASSGMGGSARASAYRSRVGKTEAPIGKNIQSESTHPFIIMTDVTGSMNKWPGIIFEKLPLLGDEVGRYAPDYEISMAAIGDGRCDEYPLQVRDFASGKSLDEHIGMLYPEGKGGPAPESYGLGAYYYLNHCTINKAVKPIFIMILDSVPHEKVLKSEIKKWTGDTVQSDLSAKTLIQQLMEKFIFYVVFAKNIGSEKNYWENLIGPQQVVVMTEPRDVVEILIGIIAAELGETEDHELRSSARHSDRPDRVSRIKESLSGVREKSKSMSVDGDDTGKSKSTKKESKKSKKSKKLV